ncbi:GtrA family protein [Thermopetrobacter sp. TC1]|uniref:GtrA family protein n=1 Tax=Thermopetrobacter sp. TC1 TaxID=1495045 RepID=UPI0006919C80|nr:GtrA family protein [Thermopetrobacter sp. TC1]
MQKNNVQMKRLPQSVDGLFISERLRPLMRFLMVGLAGLATDMAVFHLMATAGLHPYVARFISLAVATVLTWQLNRRFTFGASGRRQAEEGLRYVLVTLVAQGVNYVTFALLIAGPLSDHKSLAILFGAGVATIFSYTGHSLFSFAPKTVRSEA